MMASSLLPQISKVSHEVTVSLPRPAFPAPRICFTRQRKSRSIISSRSRFHSAAVATAANGNRVTESQSAPEKQSSQHKVQPRLVVILGKGGSGRTTAGVMLAQVRCGICVSHSRTASSRLARSQRDGTQQAYVICMRWSNLVRLHSLCRNVICALPALCSTGLACLPGRAISGPLRRGVVAAGTRQSPHRHSQGDTSAQCARRRAPYNHEDRGNQGTASHAEG